MIIARRCLVAGRVQGVFYRAGTQQKARELGIGGYAKNLPDGRVEVLAIGESASVAALVDWLRQGPPTARVTSVEVNEIELADVGEIPRHFLTA